MDDGCIPANGIPRTIMVINHQMPGSPINICKNDRVVIDVTNHMDGQGLTLHWHGLHQKETPWMDGVPMVTQCPIAPGTTFRYDFNGREPGTFFYHAHTGVHRTNGLVGIFNIRDPDDPNADYYDYDLPEHTILLTDWNNVMAEEKAPGSSVQIVIPDSVLINGFGSYLDPQLGTFTYTPTPAFHVERGHRYRFRIVNGGSHNCPMELNVRIFRLVV